MNKTLKRNLSSVAAIIVMFIALLALAGWFLKIPALTGFQSGKYSMDFNTAVCFLLAGSVLYLYNTGKLSRFKKIFILISALFIIITGLIIGLGYLPNWNQGTGELLFKQNPDLSLAGFIKVRMSFLASVKFILLGLIFIFLPKSKWHFFVQAALMFIIPVCLLVILYHVFGINFPDAIQYFKLTTLPTVLIFLILSLGIFFSQPLAHLHYSFQQKITSFFTLSILLLFFITFALNKIQGKAFTSTIILEHTNDVLIQNQEVFNLAESMESASRGYIISGNEILLEPFDKSIMDLTTSLQRLKDLTNNNLVQKKYTDSLSKFINSKIVFLQQLIKVRHQNNGAKATSSLFDTVLSSNLTDRLLTIKLAIEREESRELNKQKAENLKNIENSRRVIILFIFIIIILLFSAFLVIYSNTRLKNKAEEALIKNNLFLETILENIPNMIFVKKGEDLSFASINKAGEKLLGFPRQDLVGKNDYDFFPTEQADFFATKDREVFKQNGVIDIAEEMIKTQQGERWLHTMKIPVFDGDGKPLYMVGISEDITEKKKAADLLKKSLQEISDYKYALDESSITAITDQHGIIKQVNDNFCKISKYSREELIGQDHKIINSGTHPKEFIRNMWMTISTGETWHAEVKIKAKDGAFYWLDTTIVPFMNEQGDPYQYLAIRTDISKRKILEEEIKQFNQNLQNKVEEKTKEVIEKETQYRFLLQNMREGIQVIGFDWRYIFVNNSLADQGKYFADELIGHTMMERYPGIENSALFLVLQQCMTERVSRIMENEFTFPNGTSGWFELSIQPVPEGLFILSMDITERKRAEEAILELNDQLEKRAAELTASNKELEQFAYVASHDLQEPLRMVSSFLQLLEKKIQAQLDETTKSYIGFAIDGANRMKILIQDLLKLSGIGTNKMPFTEINCNELMNTVRSFYSLSLIETGVILHIKPLPVIKGIKPLIQQVFQNLIGNAIKYRSANTPVIEVGCIDKNQNWQFYIKDNGIGIDSAFFDKIFIIFKRLHNSTEYSGTGIGLSVCKKIIERHLGHIWVESEPGSGSTFYFTIPK